MVILLLQSSEFWDSRHTTLCLASHLSFPTEISLFPGTQLFLAFMPRFTCVVESLSGFQPALSSLCEAKDLLKDLLREDVTLSSEGKGCVWKKTQLGT